MCQPFFYGFVTPEMGAMIFKTSVYKKVLTMALLNLLTKSHEWKQTEMFFHVSKKLCSGIACLFEAIFVQAQAAVCALYCFISK